MKMSRKILREPILHICPPENIFFPSLLFPYRKGHYSYSWWLQFDERMYKERNNFLGVLLVSFPASQTSRFDRGWGDFMGSGTDQRHESIPVFPKCLSCSSVPFLLLAFVWPGTRKGHVRSSLASLNKYI